MTPPKEFHEVAPVADELGGRLRTKIKKHSRPLNHIFEGAGKFVVGRVLHEDSDSDEGAVRDLLDVGMLENLGDGL